MVVLVEIDTPGHSSVISKAFPEHIAYAEAPPWEIFAAEPPAGQLRLASPVRQNFTAIFSLLSHTCSLQRFSAPAVTN